MTIPIVSLREGVKVIVAEDILKLLLAMKPDHKCVNNVTKPQRQFVLCRVTSQFLKILHVDTANDDWQRAPHSHAILFLKEFIRLKICGSQTNL